jgi:molybdenum cofactor guanylyltransferase
MGRDKALILQNGVPWLQRTCMVAQVCADRVYVVTPWIERYQPRITAGLQQPVKWILERQTTSGSEGPLVGFAQALKFVAAHEIHPDWVLLLACDLPNLDAGQLQQWQLQLIETPEPVMARLPQHPQGWWEPMCGFYRFSCCTSLTQFVAQGGRSFQRWLTTQAVQPLSLDDPAMLLNCNTPDDLDQLTSEQSGER